MKRTTLYRFHTWFAVAALGPLVGWLVSGSLMALPATYHTLSPQFVGWTAERALSPGDPRFEDATVPAPAAVEAVRDRLGSAIEIVGVRLRRIPSHVVLEVVTRQNGTVLVDAVTGRLLSIESEDARRIVGAALPGGTVPAPTLHNESVRGYFGSLPVYRFELGDWKGTTIYVDPATAEVYQTDRWTAVCLTIFSLHTFGFMERLLPREAVDVFFFTAIGTAAVMAFTGGWMFLVRQNWWRKG